MTVLLLLVGTLVGAVLMLLVLNNAVLSDEGRRIAARMDAEQQIRDIESRALRDMAMATEHALRGSMQPSQRGGAVEGTAVDITKEA